MESVILLGAQTQPTVGLPPNIDGVAYSVVAVDAQGRLVSGPTPLTYSTPADPGAAVATISVPAAVTWELVAARFTFTTTATVGNRIIAVQQLNAVPTVIINSHFGATAASLIMVCDAAQGAGIITNAVNKSIPLPSGLVLPTGGQIKIIDLAAIDPADRVTGIVLSVRQRA